MGNSGPVSSGVTDGSRPFSSGPLASGTVDGSRPFASGPLCSGVTAGDVDDLGGLVRYGSLISVVATNKLAGLEDVDLTATGLHYVYTTGSGQSAVIRYLVVRCTAASGITVAAKAKLSKTSGAGDIFSLRRMHGLTQSGVAFVFSADGGGIKLDALSSAYFEIDEAAAGTSQLADVDLMGYTY